MAHELVVTSISRQGGGCGVAGVRVDGRGWVRLVAEQRGGTLYPHHTDMGGATQPRLLDRIEVEAPWPEQNLVQPENYLLEGTPWRLLERPANLSCLRVLRESASSRPRLFGNTEPRIRAGLLEEVPPAESLTLVEPRHLRFSIREDRENFRRRIRAHFTLGGHEWRLPLTDCLYREVLRGWPDGEYAATKLGLRPDRPIYAAIALGEPHLRWCYLTVTSIFSLPFGMGRTLDRWSTSPRFAQPQPALREPSRSLL